MVDGTLSSVEKKFNSLSMNDNKNKNTVHIGDLSLKTTISDLKELFVDYKCTNIVLKKTANEQYAYAFVTFETENEANSAIENFKYKKLHNKELLLSSCAHSKKYTDNSNVFVNKIPVGMEAKDLEKVFKNFGQIIKCKIVRDEEGVSKGYGFVMYKSSKAAAKAVEYCQNVQIDGQTLKVERYNPEKLNRNTEKETFTNCFCKNFPLSFTEQDMKALLSECGEITSVYLPRKEDNDAVGFACVNFANPESAVNAINRFHQKSLFTNKQMGKDEKFAVEPFYIQKNEKKTDRVQALKGVYGNGIANKSSKLKKNLFIKNVPSTFSYEETLNVLSQYGEITDCKLHVDKTNPDRQYGFVCFAKIEDAAVALEKSKKVLLDGVQLDLSIYRSKYERTNDVNFSEDKGEFNDVEEKKVLDNLFNKLFTAAKDYHDSFKAVGATSEREFADLFCKKMSGLSGEVLRDYVENSTKLYEYIDKEVRQK